MSPLRPTLGVGQVRLLSAAGYLSSLLPLHTVPLVNRFLVSPFLHILAGGSVYIDKGYQGICLDDHPDHYREMEYFLPKTHFAKVCMHVGETHIYLVIAHLLALCIIIVIIHVQAFAEFQDFLQEHQETLGANFVVQIRLTKQDDLWLSPFRGSGR